MVLLGAFILLAAGERSFIPMTEGGRIDRGHR